MRDIEKANKNKNKIVAVAVSVNSPGGSAVMSDMMGSKIKAFA